VSQYELINEDIILLAKEKGNFFHHAHIGQLHCKHGCTCVPAHRSVPSGLEASCAVVRFWHRDGSIVIACTTQECVSACVQLKLRAKNFSQLSQTQ
jgi:hypothetical protein